MLQHDPPEDTHGCVIRAGDWLGRALLIVLVAAIFFLRDGGISADGWLAWLALVIGLFGLLAGRARPTLGSLWPYVLYLTALTVAALRSPSPAASAELGRQLLFLTVVFSVPRLLNTPRSVAAVFAAIVVSASIVLVCAVTASLQAAADDRLTVYHAVPQWSGYPELGMLACLGAAAMIASVALGRPLALRLASGFLAGVFAVGALLLYSRLAWVTIGITALWLALVSLVRWRRMAIVLLTVALVGTAAAAVYSSPLLTRYAQTLLHGGGELEIGSRLRGWQAASAMLRDHPWFGVGPGNYPAAYPRYSTYQDPAHAYNMILHTAAELGLVGAIAYLVLWGRALVMALRLARPGGTGMLAFALHGLLVAFFVRSLGEHFLANLATAFRFLLLLAVIFGLVEALAAQSDDTRAAEGVPDAPDGTAGPGNREPGC